jgi:hypothetical protein
MSGLKLTYIILYKYIVTTWVWQTTFRVWIFVLHESQTWYKLNTKLTS